MAAVIIFHHRGRALYLEHCNFEFNNGIGHVIWTPKPEYAKRFKNIAEAYVFYNTQSKVCPFRDDGKPNRPLTAFTVEITSVE